MISKTNILSSDNFKRLLLVSFLNAFVDLGHKITVQNILFVTTDGAQQVALTATLNAFMLLPFFFMTVIAGKLSDTYPKNRLMSRLAVVAIVLTACLMLFYALGFFWAAYTATLLLATQAALYSPAKFGYAKEIAGSSFLAGANGRMQAVSIAAILLGTLLFSLPFDSLRLDTPNIPDALVHACWPLGVLLIALSILEWRYAKTLLDVNICLQKETAGLKEQLKMLWYPRTTRTAVIAVSLFFGVSQTLLAVYPAFAKVHLAVESPVLVQALIGISVVGIALGSLIAGSLGKGFIETGLAPLGAVGYAVSFSFILWLQNYALLVAAFLAIGFFSGFIIVPLSALVQQNARPESLGSTLAGFNFAQSACMLAFLALSAFGGFAGLEPSITLFFAFAIWCMLAVWLWFALPEGIARAFVGLVLMGKYDLRVDGAQNIPQSGVLLVGNHQSWIDWAVLQAVYPVKIYFLMEREIVDRPIFRWWLPRCGVISVSQNASKDSLRQVVQLLKEGRTVAIFAEGQITTDGDIGLFRRGFEVCAKQSGADILPFRISGLWGSAFSYSPKNFKGKTGSFFKREVCISFAAKMPSKSAPNTVRTAVLSA